MQPLRARVDQGAMAMKGCSIFSKPQNHWNLTIKWFSVVFRTLVVVGNLTPLQRCWRYILQLQLTGLRLFGVLCRTLLGGYPSAEVQTVYSTAPTKPTVQISVRIPSLFYDFNVFPCSLSLSTHYWNLPNLARVMSVLLFQINLLP